MQLNESFYQVNECLLAVGENPNEEFDVEYIFCIHKKFVFSKNVNG